VELEKSNIEADFEQPDYDDGEDLEPTFRSYQSTEQSSRARRELVIMTTQQAGGDVLSISSCYPRESLLVEVRAPDQKIYLKEYRIADRFTKPIRQYRVPKANTAAQALDCSIDYLLRLGDKNVLYFPTAAARRQLPEDMHTNDGGSGGSKEQPTPIFVMDEDILTDLQGGYHEVPLPRMYYTMMTVLNGFAVGKTVVVLGSADELILGYGLTDAFVPLPSIPQMPSAILEISSLPKIHPNSVFVFGRGYATRLEVRVEHAFNQPFSVKLEVFPMFILNSQGSHELSLLPYESTFVPRGYQRSVFEASPFMVVRDEEAGFSLIFPRARALLYIQILHDEQTRMCDRQKLVSSCLAHGCVSITPEHMGGRRQMECFSCEMVDKFQRIHKRCVVDELGLMAQKCPRVKRCIFSDDGMVNVGTSWLRLLILLGLTVILTFAATIRYLIHVRAQKHGHLRIGLFTPSEEDNTLMDDEEKVMDVE